MIKIEDLRNIYNIEEIEGLEIKNYVPLTTKYAIIKKTLDELIKIDDHGMYTINNLSKRMTFHLSVVLLYTNIELTDDDFTNYDILHEYNLYNQIVSHIGFDCYEFEDLFDDFISDKLEENNFNYLLARKSDDVIKLLDKTMEHVNAMLDKGDPNVISKYITDMLNELIKKIPDLTTANLLEMVKELRK